MYLSWFGLIINWTSHRKFSDDELCASSCRQVFVHKRLKWYLEHVLKHFSGTWEKEIFSWLAQVHGLHYHSAHELITSN